MIADHVRHHMTVHVIALYDAWSNLTIFQIMAKRHLGLAKAAKAKKHKQNPEQDAEQPLDLAENQLTVELDEEIDPNDAVGQVSALWRTFSQSDDKNELMVNGIIHECDRILRKAHNEQKLDDNEVIELSGRFYAIYAQALAALAFFHTEEAKKVAEFFKEASDRIELGKKAFPELVELLFAEARILMNKIPLTEVARMEADSRIGADFEDVSALLDKSLGVWEQAEEQAAKASDFQHFNSENLDFLQALDDFLDMVDNFGAENMEGEDSDSEDEESALVELKEDHPLYATKKLDKYNKWWRDHSVVFLKHLDSQITAQNATDSKHPLLELKRELCKRIGQSYLMEAEEPSSIFTTLTYYSKDAKEMNGLTREDAQRISQELFTEALKYLKQAQDEEDPDTWANVAEAMISLANTHDLESAEQEKIYHEAEKLLDRANIATNGLYEDILENLLLK